MTVNGLLCPPVYDYVKKLFTWLLEEFMRNLMIGLASVALALVFFQTIDSSPFAGVFRQSIGATQDLAAIRLPRVDPCELLS